MKSVLRTLVCLLLCVLSTAQSYVVAVEVPVEPDYTVESVPLRKVSVLDILGVESIQGLEELLFPSGMLLPTKYLDIFSFFDPAVDRADTTKEVATFLNSAYPDAGGLFTMAEIKAAELYVGLLYATSADVRSQDSPDIYGVQRFMEDAKVKLTGADMTSITVSDLDKFKAILQEHSFILAYSEIDSADEAANYWEYGLLTELQPDGSPLLGLGDRFMFASLYSKLSPANTFFGGDSEYDAEVSDQLANFWRTRLQYMSLMGLEVVNAGLPTQFVEHVPSAAVEEGGEIATTPLDVETVPVETTVVKPTPAPAFNPKEYEYPASVTEFSAGIQGGVVQTTGPLLNAQDVLLRVSLVVVCVASVVLCILDFIRKRKDPARTFRWKRK